MRIYLLTIAITVSLQLFAKDEPRIYAPASREDALNRKGVQALNEHKYDDALEYFREAAREGDNQGLENIAHCFYFGFGVAQNADSVIYYAEKPALNGFKYAQKYIALVYNLKKNYTQAYNFANLAAQQGDAECQYLLSWYYSNGYGTGEDIDKAIYWMEKSEENGFSHALTALGLLYYNKDDLKSAAEQWRKAASKGSVEAQFYLGRLLYDSSKKNNDNSEEATEAVEWLTRAAAQGFAKAYPYLGLCYLYGYGCTPDSKKAIDYWDKGAELDDIMSMYSLGLQYYYGEYIPKDFDKAFSLLSRSCNDDEVIKLTKGDSLKILSSCYRYGLGTEENTAEADRLLRLYQKYKNDKNDKITPQL